MFKRQQGVLILCVFLSELTHVTGQEYCGWVTTDKNRKVASKEKAILDQKRNEEYCTSKESNGSASQIFCSARYHHDSYYLRTECYCNNHGCNNSFKCERYCLDYQDIVCMNKGRIDRELCKEKNVLQCECDEGFTGDLCQDVLERRKCQKALPSEEKGLTKCGQGNSSEANCRLQFQDKQLFVCFEAANDSESIEKIQRLPNCSQDFFHSELETDSPSTSNSKSTGHLMTGDGVVKPWIIGLIICVVLVAIAGIIAGFLRYRKRADSRMRRRRITLSRNGDASPQLIVEDHVEEDNGHPSEKITPV